ncbi:MAG: PhoH family protein [Candidatus Anammoxibacter sp.]
MVGKIEKTILIDDVQDASILYGNHDKYLRLIRNELGVDIVARNGMVKVTGNEDRVKAAYDIFDLLINIVKSSGKLLDDDVNKAIKKQINGHISDRDCGHVGVKERVIRNGNTKWSEPFWNPDVNDNISNNDGTLLNKDETGEQDANSVDDKIFERLQIDVFFKGASIRPKTVGQCSYVEAIKKNDVVFCIGSAGTGKTYLAVALAISALKNEIVKKIVLARPAVEAGEKLGFLPGDIHAKINPYLRPLYDALAKMMDAAQVKKYIENDIIEILPLAFMRGRTLDNSFIILDEAQNCTTKQMKTFLTRLGTRSRVVVTGDITQVDLPVGEKSGLIDVQKKLTNISGISFIHLGKNDIIRHQLIKDILSAYEKGEKC